LFRSVSAGSGGLDSVVGEETKRVGKSAGLFRDVGYKKQRDVPAADVG
jgi:hypothetical protein